MTFNRKIWNLKAGVYPWLRKVPVIRSIFKWEKQHLQVLLPESFISNQPALDIGTGRGDSLDIWPVDQRLICIDHSHKMLHAMAHQENNSLAVVAKADCLPFQANSVGLITAIGITEYLADKPAFLREMYRLLAVNGYLLCTFSPPKLGNYLRYLLGNRLFFISNREWEGLLSQSNFQIRGKRSTFLQAQYLVQKANKQ